MLQTTFKSQILPFGFNPIFLVKGAFGFFFVLFWRMGGKVDKDLKVVRVDKDFFCRANGAMGLLIGAFKWEFLWI